MQHLERGRDGLNEFWRYFVVSLVVFVAMQLGSIPLVVLAVNAMAHGRGDLEVLLTNPARMGYSGTTVMALMVFSFAVGLLALVLIVRKLHRRRASDIINGTRRIRWPRVFFAAGAWMGLQFVYLGISWALDPENFVFRFDPAAFFPLLLVSVLMIPLQTSLEELYFRGYLAQGIGAGTGSRWAAILIPGIIFGLIHIGNPEVEEYGLLLTLPQYILFGLLFGFISTLDDGIECAMGAHAANNIFASTVVTFKASALSTDALFEQKLVSPGRELVWLLIMGSVFALILWRRYRWNSKTLSKPVGANDAADGLA